MSRDDDESIVAGAAQQHPIAQLSARHRIPAANGRVQRGPVAN